MSTILQEIETQIAGLKTSTTKSNTGIVREAGDGVVKIEGLSDVMLNEMIEFPGGTYGLALNLEETTKSAASSSATSRMSRKARKSKPPGRLLQVLTVGKGLLGRA